jgi:PAS domain S-box-containing protein/putative nucleotidyltransferase with HDIG domain
MYKHENLLLVYKILENPEPSAFEAPLNNFCNNLSFDAAVLYSNNVNPQKLTFFAGVYKGSPAKKIMERYPILTEEDVNIERFLKSGQEIIEINADTLPEEARNFVKNYNIDTLYIIPLITLNRNYGIVLAGREKPYPLSEDEKSLIKVYIDMFGVLLDLYYTKWTYEVVRSHIREHIVIQDLEHNLIEANKAAALSLGMENPDDLKGKKCYELWHHRNLPCVNCPLEKTRKTLKPEESEVMTPDGRWFYIRSNPILSGTGQLIGFVELTLEITEKVKAEREARKFQEILKKVFEQPYVGIQVLSQNGTIEEANPASAKMLGHEVEEIAKKPFKNFIPTPASKLFLEKLEKNKKGEVKFISTDIKIIDKDGKEQYNRVYATPIELQNEESKTLLVSTDITEDIKLREKLKKRTEEIIFAFSHIVELKEPYTAGHQKRVAEIATIVAKELGLPQDEIEIMRYAGLLHDMGKIIVPIEILNKPARLTEYEFNLVKEHPRFGYEILKDIEFDGPVAEIVYQHHERIDGSGYPRGLKNSEIHLGARILACADSIEAMTSHRPYRAALSLEKAMEELNSLSGFLYDPEVVNIIEHLYKKGIIKEILEKS